jgi:hypothetical protein
VPEIFDFPRDIQPILDKHCLSCHDYVPHGGQGPRAGSIALCGDRGPMYSHSYFTLLSSRGLVSHGSDAGGNRPPRTIGSSASRLLKLTDGSHYAARLSPREAARLRLWIDSGVFYPGTYAALGTGMVNVALPGGIAQRCGPCHAVDKERRSPRFRTDPDLACNLTRPELSLLLLAPLAAQAGGYGLCKPKPPAPAAQRPKSLDDELASILNGDPKKADPPPAVFASTDDPDYRKLLDAIRAAGKRLEAIKRFDMPGFRPNEPYLREMKRYGILPAALGPADPVDPYAADQAYWRSFWLKP